MAAETDLIRITLNGAPREIAPGTTVDRLLDELGVQARHCAVERNLELIPRGRYQAERLAAGDQIEVVTLVGGG